MATAGELLKFICDYQALVGRRSLLRLPLTAADTERLARLEELLANGVIDETDASTRRRYTRNEVALQATIEVGARAASVVIANISAGGAFVKQPTPALRRGDPTMITVMDGSERSFLFPAKVIWSSEERGLGLSFVGIPKELLASDSGPRRAIVS